jgi:hypothetical protein
MVVFKLLYIESKAKKNQGVDGEWKKRWMDGESTMTEGRKTR